MIQIGRRMMKALMLTKGFGNSIDTNGYANGTFWQPPVHPGAHTIHDVAYYGYKSRESIPILMVARSDREIIVDQPS
jgi:hypothetical protein